MIPLGTEPVRGPSGGDPLVVVVAYHAPDLLEGCLAALDGSFDTRNEGSVRRRPRRRRAPGQAAAAIAGSIAGSLDGSLAASGSVGGGCMGSVGIVGVC